MQSYQVLKTFLMLKTFASKAKNRQIIAEVSLENLIKRKPCFCKVASVVWRNQNQPLQKEALSQQLLLIVLVYALNKFSATFPQV